MHAEENSFHDFLLNMGKHYEIPVFQRPYSWGKEQCQQLFDDIVFIIRHGTCTHFTGSIVAVDEKGNFVISIIDGQQRVTTVSLFVMALIYLCADKKKLKSRERLFQYIVHKLSTDNDYEEEEVLETVLDPKDIALRLHVDDQNIFHKICTFLDAKKDNTSTLLQFDKDLTKEEKKSRIYQNFWFFVRVIEKTLQDDQEPQVKLSDLENALNRLKFVLISLSGGQEDEDPQAIFESINSTGVDLSQGDRVRNFLLMSCDIEHQKIFYQQYWYPIEHLILTSKDMDNFIKDYMSSKTGRIPASNAVYTELKKYAEQIIEQQRCSSLELRQGLLEDLLAYAQNYTFCQGLQPKAHIAKVSPKLKRLLRQTFAFSSTGGPLLMFLMDSIERSRLSEQECIRVVELVMSFIIRRFICNSHSSSSLKSVFVELAVLFKSLSEKYTREELLHGNYYFEALGQYVLTRGENSFELRMPSEEAFLQNFMLHEYKDAKTKSFFLRALHMFEDELLGKEPDEYEDCTHIQLIPSSLTTSWKDHLGDEAAAFLKGHYAYRLGNFCLSDVNARNTDSLKRKKELFANSRREEIRELAARPQWDIEMIQSSTQHYLDLAVQLWPYPEILHQHHVEEHLASEEREQKWWSFNDTFDVQEYFPCALEIDEQITKDLEDWLDFLQNICVYLYSKSTPSFMHLVQHQSVLKDKIFVGTTHGQPLRPFHLVTGVSIEEDLSSEELFELAKELWLSSLDDVEDESAPCLRFQITHGC